MGFTVSGTLFDVKSLITGKAVRVTVPYQINGSYTVDALIKTPTTTEVVVTYMDDAKFVPVDLVIKIKEVVDNDVKIEQLDVASTSSTTTTTPTTPTT